MCCELVLGGYTEFSMFLNLNLMNNGLEKQSLLDAHILPEITSFRLNEFTDDASTINDGRLFHALMTLWVKKNLQTFNLL